MAAQAWHSLAVRLSASRHSCNQAASPPHLDQVGEVAGICCRDVAGAVHSQGEAVGATLRGNMEGTARSSASHKQISIIHSCLPEPHSGAVAFDTPSMPLGQHHQAHSVQRLQPPTCTELMVGLLVTPTVNSADSSDSALSPCLLAALMVAFQVPAPKQQQRSVCSNPSLCRGSCHNAATHCQHSCPWQYCMLILSQSSGMRLAPSAHQPPG